MFSLRNATQGKRHQNKSTSVASRIFVIRWKYLSFNQDFFQIMTNEKQSETDSAELAENTVKDNQEKVRLKILNQKIL